GHCRQACVQVRNAECRRDPEVRKKPGELGGCAITPSQFRQRWEAQEHEDSCDATGSVVTRLRTRGVLRIGSVENIPFAVLENRCSATMSASGSMLMTVKTNSEINPSRNT